MGDAEAVLTRAARPPDLTLSYSQGPDRVVDVRLPGSGDPGSLVIVVHGGFWRAAYDRSHAGPQSAALADAGFVVATVEYRRVGQPRGGWTGTFDDITLMTDVVPGLVGRAVGNAVHSSPPVLVGHSAGGHLAAWAAARHRLHAPCRWRRPTPLPLAGVVCLAGVMDLDHAERLGLGDGAVRELLGGTKAQLPQRYAETNPAELLPLDVPVRLVHGSRDRVVPVEVSRAFAERARAAGDDATLHELVGTGHYELIDPLADAWASVLGAIRELTGSEG